MIEAKADILALRNVKGKNIGDCLQALDADEQTALLQLLVGLNTDDFYNFSQKSVSGHSWQTKQLTAQVESGREVIEVFIHFLFLPAAERREQLRCASLIELSLGGLLWRHRNSGRRKD